MKPFTEVVVNNTILVGKQFLAIADIMNKNIDKVPPKVFDAVMDAIQVADDAAEAFSNALMAEVSADTLDEAVGGGPNDYH